MDTFSQLLNSTGDIDVDDILIAYVLHTFLLLWVTMLNDIHCIKYISRNLNSLNSVFMVLKLGIWCLLVCWFFNVNMYLTVIYLWYETTQVRILVSLFQIYLMVDHDHAWLFALSVLPNCYINYYSKFLLDISKWLVEQKVSWPLNFWGGECCTPARTAIRSSIS